MPSIFPLKREFQLPFSHNLQVLHNARSIGCAQLKLVQDRKGAVQQIKAQDLLVGHVVGDEQKVSAIHLELPFENDTQQRRSGVSVLVKEA